MDERDGWSVGRGSFSASAAMAAMKNEAEGPEQAGIEPPAMVSLDGF